MTACAVLGGFGLATYPLPSWAEHDRTVMILSSPGQKSTAMFPVATATLRMHRAGRRQSRFAASARSVSREISFGVVKIAGSSVCPKLFRIGILSLFISVSRY